MRRAWALLVLVLGLTLQARATTVPDGRGAWIKATVPIELRARVHMNAREVPGFPDDDPKLVELKSWPRKRRIGGWNCELHVMGLFADRLGPNRVVPARPGSNQTTSAYYLCHRQWWPWGRPEEIGPSYSWSSDGHLTERSFHRSRTDVVRYQVDRAGRPVGFVDRKHGTEEYFDVDGVLIAGEYAPVNLDWRSEGYRGGTVSVWLGSRVTRDEFERRRDQWFRTIAGRY